MMKLNHILKGVEVTKVTGSQECMISDITFDSRKVSENSLFIAVRGTQTDGHQFIAKAVASGAKAVLCEEIPSDVQSKDVVFILTPDSSKALGFVASNWFGNPSSKLKLVGITGTNGKTTTVTLLHSLFGMLGFKAGLLSTIVNKIGNETVAATHTTPDAIQLNALLNQMVESGCEYCFMEVSSHSVVQHRIAGLQFAGGIFSNITHDHLDYHKTFAEYISAKKGFFDGLPDTAFALTNIDDKNGSVMLQNTKAAKYTYSLQSMADFKGRVIELPLDGIFMEFNGTETWCRLVGLFNAYNLLATYSTAVLLGIDPMEVLIKLSSIESVEGRFDYVKSADEIIGIVDYAHTPDALKNVLSTIAELRTGQESVITVVGCGGDRDRTKRPVMASIAAAMSNKVIITSDNPRSEDPQEIINEMLKGIDKQDEKRVFSIADRREAIKLACGMAQKGDIILVAGKGHEKYQDIKGVKHPFDDKQILNEMLNKN